MLRCCAGGETTPSRLHRLCCSTQYAQTCLNPSVSSPLTPADLERGSSRSGRSLWQPSTTCATAALVDPTAAVVAAAPSRNMMTIWYLQRRTHQHTTAGTGQRAVTGLEARSRTGRHIPHRSVGIPAGHASHTRRPGQTNTRPAFAIHMMHFLFYAGKPMLSKNKEMNRCCCSHHSQFLPL